MSLDLPVPLALTGTSKHLMYSVFLKYHYQFPCRWFLAASGNGPKPGQMVYNLTMLSDSDEDETGESVIGGHVELVLN